MKKLAVFLICAIMLYGGFKLIKPAPNKEGIIDKIKPTVLKLKIIDEKSKNRPIAVMYDNHNNALPHSGLQDAYIVYEMVAEGGITRLMALFRDENTDKPIGPIRSVRHYFLDYVMENDAIFVHHGWSEPARFDINKYKINNINGLYDSVFWRDKSSFAPHNSFTNLNKVIELANKREYTRDINSDILFNYSAKEINLDKNDNSVAANNVSIRYSNYMTSSYEYDDLKKVYNRIRQGEPHIDRQTKEQYTVKNIIVVKVNNYSIDNYGRQELENTGQGDGYYITNGYAVPIKWYKENRFLKTIYKTLDGKEIILNDGNTFIQIQPINEKLIIE